MIHLIAWQVSGIVVSLQYKDEIGDKTRTHLFYQSNVMKLILFEEAHALCCHIEMQGISFFAFLKLWKPRDHILDVVDAGRVFTSANIC